jgi:MFS transporter, CP family, cyanate transporter
LNWPQCQSCKAEKMNKKKASDLTSTTGHMNGMTSGKSFIAVCLLWICGLGLRFSVLAVPPVIPLIRSDLHLSGTEVGILSGLPVFLFAILATPGSLLISRMGVLSALLTGLVVAAIGSALRAAVVSTSELYAATVLMGAGIAIMQPAMAAAVQQWLPSHVAFGTAIYTNGLIVGEIVPVGLMLPVVLPYFNQSWRWGLAVWSLPLVAIAIAVAIFAPRSIDSPVGTRSLPRWWPDWSSKLNWRIGLIVGSVASVYFCSNAFIPAYLSDAGRPDLISSALTALNLGQLPASFLLLRIANRLERKRWPYVTFGALGLLSVIGIISTASAWTVAWAGMVGFSCGASLALGLALPPLLSQPDEIASTSAAAFVISYGFAMIISLLGGAAWDISGVARFAFLPIMISALPVLILAPGIRFPSRP